MESHDLLKNHHLRITPIREKVLDVFLSRGGEAIPKLIIEERLVRFDRVTLYRTIKQFEEKMKKSISPHVSPRDSCYIIDPLVNPSSWYYI